MVIVDCPHPGCTFNTSNVADAPAATLLQIHASGSHPGGTPDGGQNNGTSTFAVAHVMKVQCPTISAGWILATALCKTENSSVNSYQNKKVEKDILSFKT